MNRSAVSVGDVCVACCMMQCVAILLLRSLYLRCQCPKAGEVVSKTAWLGSIPRVPALSSVNIDVHFQHTGLSDSPRTRTAGQLFGSAESIARHCTPRDSRFSRSRELKPP